MRKFKFQYTFSASIACILIRVLLNLEFHATIGPLTKIFGKMTKDFTNFCILFVLFTLMFALVGNINLLLVTQEYRSFFQSTLSVINNSLGNLDYGYLDNISDPELKTIAALFTIISALFFNIIFFNFLVSVLSDTYSTFDSKSNALFLSKILSTRDEMTYEPTFGAFIA